MKNTLLAGVNMPIPPLEGFFVIGRPKFPPFKDQEDASGSIATIGQNSVSSESVIYEAG